MINPSNPLEWILTILLFVISLSVLITLHELGHLTMAKIFKVYCHDFSIGFGPALLHVKRKKGETYFSIRAIPLGGFVSMYGEGDQIDESLNIPKSRSIAGINRWKRAVIFVAGVVMNIIIAFTFFTISDVFLPTPKATREMNIVNESASYAAGFKSDDKIGFMGPNVTSRVYYEFEHSLKKYAGYYYIVDDEVMINDEAYVALYSPLGVRDETKLTDAISFYKATTYEEAIKYSCSTDLHPGLEDTFIGWHDLGIDLKHYPDLTGENAKLVIKENMSTSLDVLIQEKTGEDTYADPITKVLTLEAIGSENIYKWKDVGLYLKVTSEYAPFGERVANVFIDFGSSAVGVFKGIISLFTGQITNLSGIVGIFSTSASVYASYGFAYYLYFWGFISVNLAIFNLLPFPGLDGWQLLVTALEGSVNLFKRSKYKKTIKNLPEDAPKEEFIEWKIPLKVKTIMSLVGIGLLLVLGVGIIILDIVRLFL